jgi:glutamate racemase
VDAIEDGDFILAEALVQSHVDALHRKMPHPQAAILGCTHYPLMHDTFQKVLGPKVKIFSQAHLVAESLEDYLQRYPDKLGTQTKGKFLTTGDPMKVSQRATQFLKRSLTFESA